MCRVAFVLSFATSIAAMLLLWAVYPKDYDFGASTKVRLFFGCMWQHLRASLLVRVLFGACDSIRLHAYLVAD